MIFKRILYLAYYLKNLNVALFRKFSNHVKKTKKNTLPSQCLHILRDIFRYNISILEYYQFRFFEKTPEEKKAWAGTGYMYEYQLRMNPPDKRQILDDKTKFYKYYSEFFVHQVADLNDLKNDPDKTDKLLANPAGKIVFKVGDGKCGTNVQIKKTDEFTRESLIRYLENSPFDLVEEYILQHPDINELSPSAVNTVRIFSQLNNENEVDYLGSRLRISVNSNVDNMAAGNMAAPIDNVSGIVTGPAVYSDITKDPEFFHPVSNVEINGFQIPYWNDILIMIEKAHKKHPQNRSIGWDIVVTEKGPGLIEGNHDWCKLLWQLPVQQGLKPMLEYYEKP